MNLRYLKNKADMNDLHDALAAANPGDGIVYHRGQTISDEKGGQLAIARHAYNLYERGHVLLTQKPTGPASNEKRLFDYIAVKRAK